MRNRRILHFEKPASAQPPALTEQILATTCLSLLEDKSPGAPYYAPTGPGEAERAIARPPRVFDDLYCKLGRRCDAESAPPVRRRALAIIWVETRELPLEINVTIGRSS